MKMDVANWKCKSYGKCIGISNPFPAALVSMHAATKSCLVDIRLKKNRLQCI